MKSVGIFACGLLLGFGPALLVSHWLHPKPTPCPVIEPQIQFDETPQFGDLRVIETVSRKQLSRDEIMELLDKLPNVKSVSLPMRDKLFTTYSLAYPQHAYDYQIPVPVWAELQAYVRQQLADGAGVDTIRAHWQSIADGTPPFGLQVAKE